MYLLNPSLVLTLLFLNTAWMVNAGLYVRPLAIYSITFDSLQLQIIKPLQGSVCRANQPCTVTWLDDGRAPLLSSIGVSTVGLFTGCQLRSTAHFSLLACLTR